MSQNVLMIGSWHLGSVVGACVADSGNKVFMWDQSSKIAEKWSKGAAPIHEPGLDDLVKKYWGTQIFWAGEAAALKSASGLAEASKTADWIMLTYDTPVNDKDEIVFDVVEEGFNEVMKTGFKNDCHFFFTAQLPVGTSRRFLSKIKEANPRWKGFVFYMPENLRLGEALKSFKTPDRMVVGVHESDPAKREAGVKLFRALIRDEKTPINIMSLESAEMVKHALNAFLATCVVFANEVSEICEGRGADAWDVMSSLKQDTRVGPKAFLRPGLGFSGGTLARDVKTLSKFAVVMGDKGENNYFSTLYRVNTERNDWIVSQLKAKLHDLKGKNILLFGVTYKPGTSTVRRSPALEVGSLLKSLGAHCVALDPMADLDELTSQERKDLPFEMLPLKSSAENWTQSVDLSLLKNIDAAVVVTEWPQFTEFDFNKIEMKTPLIIDTKNLFAKNNLKPKFDVIVPGKPVVQ